VFRQDGKLYAINPDGSLFWSFSTSEWIVDSPAVGADGVIYFGSNDKKIYALNSDGTLLWSYTTGNHVYVSPTIAVDGTLYIASGNILYAFNDAVSPSTVYVNGITGNDSWDGTSPTYNGGTTGPKKTIQAAVDVVADGGTVYVASGTYNENLNINQNIVLMGESQTGTIIDGSQTTVVITVNGVTVNLTNFTIQNGNAPWGGGIYNYAGILTITCTTIINNSATYGGGIYNDGTITITNSIITDNNATYGGGIYNEGTLTANYNTIIKNSLYNAGGSVDARFNWWGSNNPDFSSLIIGPVDYIPWLYMTITADPTTINKGNSRQVSVSFNNLYDGTTVTSFDPSVGHIPDGTVVELTVDFGMLDPVEVTTLNGTATSTYTGTSGGTADITAGTDEQTVSTTVTVDEQTNTNDSIVKIESSNSSDNGSSNMVNAAMTIGMQKTGVNLIGILMAVLMILGGLFSCKKKE